MTTNDLTAYNTGDYPYQAYSVMPYHNCWQYPCPICNPPAYYPVPYYVPVPQPYTVGTIVFAPDTELKEEVKQLKDEIRKLRKELAKK